MTDALIPNYARYPVTFVSGSGAVLRDDAGEEYLDFLAGIGVCNAGHCHPRVVEAVRAQAGELLHVSNLFFTPPMTALAERLAGCSLGPGSRVFFCNSGAEANEAALKLARKARRGGGFVVAHGGFHGRTYGALSATPQESKQAPFAPLVPGFVAVQPAELASSVGPDTAAVVVEVIQGESGVHPIDHSILREVRAACDEHGALLIVDEVQTGIGRTGTLFAYEQVGVVPDAITLAKGLGGGLPIGALVAGPSCAEVFEPGDHGSTFAGNPLVSAAALAALDVVDTPELLASVMDLGERLREGLRELPRVRSVRGRGLMVACEVDADAPGVVRRLLLDHRLVCNAPGPTTIRFLPPLIVTEDQIDDAVARVGRALAA